MRQQKPYSVVIADDHEMIRHALRDLLLQHEATTSTGFSIVGYAENGLEAIALMKAQQPDLMFLDISMPLATGAEIILDLKRWSPQTRIVVYTGIQAPGLIATLVQSGVDGMFSKGGPSQVMIEQLDLILQGGRYIAPEFVRCMEQAEQIQQLTERERQTLNMVIAGKSNKEMADLLHISPKTVEKHRTSLMNKLGVHSVAQLMAHALKAGLIEPN